jgi:putative transposase
VVNSELLIFYYFSNKIALMPVRPELIEKFEPEKYYHVVCKAIAGKKLFHSDANKLFFLKRYRDLVAPFVKTLAYNLLNNHVHMVIKAIPVTLLTDRLSGEPPETVTKTQSRFMESSDKEILYHELIEQQFNRLFISYVRALNIQLNTSGHLFERPFKRIGIHGDAHLQQAIIYVHANEQKHGLVNDFTRSGFSSYHDIMHNRSEIVDCASVINFFGAADQYEKIHGAQVSWFYSRGWPSSKLE